MKTFQVTILGTSAAVPAYNRHLSAQIVQIANEVLLIDCGEGTQFQLLEYPIKFHKIDHIFISHLHGDHTFGLPGLLMSLALGGRKDPLHIYSPEDLTSRLIPLIGEDIGYPIHYHVNDPEVHQVILETKNFKVSTLPLVHRVPCHGFLIEEQQAPDNMRKEPIEAYSIPYTAIPAIKAGGDFELPDGKIIPHEELTNPAPPVRKFAYCSDTRYTLQNLELLKGVDLLYHEATFLHELLPQAEKTMHTTAKEASQVAALAAAKQLIIGHFSPRYADLAPLLEEAQAVFPASRLAVEGEVLVVGG